MIDGMVQSGDRARMKVSNKLIQVFLTLGLTNEEIDDLIDLCPGLLVRDEERILRCMTTLTAFGFPRLELPNFIKINPNFLLGDPKHIAGVLSSIDGNIEQVLFENPYII